MEPQDNQRQLVGDNIQFSHADWSFNGNVPDNFKNHIARSIPNYLSTHQLVLDLAPYFLDKNSICYDLGVSTGELLRKLYKSYQYKTHFIGIDIVPEMVAKAKENHLNEFDQLKGTEYICADILNYKFFDTSLFVSLYTLQFIHIHERAAVLSNLFNALKNGAALICFEKVFMAYPQTQDISQKIYDEFKIQNGLKPSEIMAKAKSLRSVLRPQTSQENLDLFKRVGFSKIEVIYKYLCFEGYLLIK